MMKQIQDTLASSHIFSNFGSVASIGAALILLASTWRYILNFFNVVRNMLFSRSLYKQEASAAILCYISNKGKSFKFGIRAYRGTKHYINPIKRVEAIAYEDITDEPSFVWIDRRPMIIKRSGSDNKTQTGDLNNYYNDTGGDNPIELITLRGFVNLDKFVLKALQFFNERHQVSTIDKPNDQRRFTVRRLGKSASMQSASTNPKHGNNNTQHADEVEKQLRNQVLRLLRWNVEDIGQRKTTNSAFNVFFYPPEVMKLVDEIRMWLKYEDWFKNKGIPWRLGCLFYGKGGTGKTSLVRCVAMEMDLPVFIFDLSSMDNASLGEAWEEVQQNAPAIALIEDIDSVFNLRENVCTTNVMRDSLTYDCLLNTISGVKNSDGVLLCVTTNDISKLDPALGIPEGTVDSTRPGRIDRAVELVDMRQEERRKVAEYILKDTDANIEQIIKDGDKETAAQFQSRCTTIALRLFWSKNTLNK